MSYFVMFADVCMVVSMVLLLFIFTYLMFLMIRLTSKVFFLRRACVLGFKMYKIAYKLEADLQIWTLSFTVVFNQFK